MDHPKVSVWEDDTDNTDKNWKIKTRISTCRGQYTTQIGWRAEVRVQTYVQRLPARYTQWLKTVAWVQLAGWLLKCLHRREGTAEIQRDLDEPVKENNKGNQVAYNKIEKVDMRHSKYSGKTKSYSMHHTYWISLETEVACPYFCSEVNLTVKVGWKLFRV